MRQLIPRVLKITVGDRNFPGEKGDRYVHRCRGGAGKLTVLLASR